MTLSSRVRARLATRRPTPSAACAATGPTFTLAWAVALFPTEAAALGRRLISLAREAATPPGSGQP
jgi:hypothetical protein